MARWHNYCNHLIEMKCKVCGNYRSLILMNTQMDGYSGVSVSPAQKILPVRPLVLIG